MKCRHYDRIVPGCAYCDSIIESERQERAERDRAVIVETLEGRLACETALVDTLRTDVSRLTSALDVALESARSAEHRVDTLRAENARLREALEAATAEGVWLGDLAVSLERGAPRDGLTRRLANLRRINLELRHGVACACESCVSAR